MIEQKRIVLTKERAGIEDAIIPLEDLGAEIIFFPTIKIVPLADYSKTDKYLLNLEYYNYLILTSVNAVEMFFDRIDKLGIPLNRLTQSIAAIGIKTGDMCKEYGLNVNLIPDEFSAEGMVKLFSVEKITGQKILIPASSLSRDYLQKNLTDLGNEVDAVPIYDVEIIDSEESRETIEYLKNEKADLFAFTSPSNYKNFCLLLKLVNPASYFENVDVAAIGSVTQKAIENNGVKVSIIPNEFTIESLVKKIVEYYSL